MKFKTFFDSYSMENYIKPPKLYQTNILKSKIYWSAKDKEFHSCRKFEKKYTLVVILLQLFWLYSIFYFGKNRRCRTRIYFELYFVATILPRVINLLFREKVADIEQENTLKFILWQLFGQLYWIFYFRRSNPRSRYNWMLAKNHSSWCESKISTLPFTFNMHPDIYRWCVYA